LSGHSKKIYTAVSVLFGLFMNHSLGIAQELPPKYTVAETIQTVCSKWVGKTFSNGQKKIVLSQQRCDAIAKDSISKLEYLVAGLTSDLKPLIRGETTLQQIKTKYQNEGMNCGGFSASTDIYFANLSSKLECSMKQEFSMNLTFYGDKNKMAGGVYLKANDIDGAFQIPRGNLGLFLKDVFNSAGNAVVPGHSQLLLSFNPFTITYKEYYLRRPISQKSGKWIGYVIKVMDYGMLKGHERIKKMIFPENRTYNSQNECYSEFEKKISREPLNSRYPQTDNAMTSYLFGCIEK